MLAVYDKDGTAKIIRPAPLISITQNPIRNKAGNLGSYYDIVLTGTVLSDLGAPNFSETYPTNTTHDNAADTVAIGSAMAHIIKKQLHIRKLFAHDGLRCELLGIDGEIALVFYPTVQSITFDEGVYINHAKYTINLRAEVLLDSSEKVVRDSLPNSTFVGNISTHLPSRTDSAAITLVQAIEASGFVEDYSETWSIEPQEGRGITDTSIIQPTSFEPNDHVKSIRSYSLTRTISATGRTIYYDEGGTGGDTKRREAWEQARTYIYKCILKDPDNNSTNNSTGYEQYPEYSIGPYFGSGYLNIAKDIFGGYNHLRTETFDVAAGTFTLQDTWLLSSGTAYEDYKLSVSRARDGSNIYTVNVDGTIKGLSSQHAGGKSYGGNNTDSAANLPAGAVLPLNSPYQNALYKWHSVSNSGIYGPQCNLFYRAQAAVFATLNHVPASVAVSANEFTGEITYNVEYDTRPKQAVSGTLSENITCNDTYPGDVFVVLPVIGRQNGPMIQYLNSRTEYQRNLSIDLVFDRYYASGVGGNIGAKQFFLLSKPTLNEPFRSQIRDIIQAFSPSGETGIKKYFVNPPNESWDAASGRYSLNINWVYELNR